MISKKTHRSGVSQRKRDRIVDRSMSIGIGSDRPASGFGYIIIPTDIEREDYINYVYRSGTCMIVTDFNEVVKDARIPKHLISEIRFPDESAAYGPLVSWINTPKINQVTLTGILIKPNEVYGYNQWTKAREYSFKNRSFTEVINLNAENPTYAASLVNEFTDDGEMSFSTSSETGRAELTIKLDATIKTYADKLNTVQAYEKVEIIVGNDDDENKSTLTIDKDGNFEYIDFNGNYIKIEDGKMTVESPEILHGEDATEPALLGDTSMDLIGQILDGIIALTVPTGVGPSGTPVNAAVFTNIKAQLDTAKSQKNKIE